ncbi:MAG TPA: class IV adenylate cyclase [Blastocatellia bacterium]|nr:class IV adenylate cyclase [Blastocatellia bacterium]
MKTATKAGMQTTIETEVKLACEDLSRLVAAGFELSISAPRHFEDNWLLDWPDQTLFKQGAALRVRAVGGKGLVTFKGVVPESETSPLKVREEIESDTSDPSRMIDLFERVGLRRIFRYQKYRTDYALRINAEELKVSYDETPMGNFVEIEGDGPSILRVLETAGFSNSEIIRESYPDLQLARCQSRGVPLEDLVF